MSQPADPASGAAPAITELTIDIAELALLAHLDGRLPLVLPALPPQPEEAWREVLDHVVERGLLVRDGDTLTVHESVGGALLPIVVSAVLIYLLALLTTKNPMLVNWYTVGVVGAFALLRLKIGVMPVIAASAACGLVWQMLLH